MWTACFAMKVIQVCERGPRFSFCSVMLMLIWNDKWFRKVSEH